MRNKKRRRELFKIFLLILLLTLLIISLIQNKILSNNLNEKIIEKDFSSYNERLSQLFSEAQNFPEGADKDIIFLTEMSSLTNFLENKTEKNKALVKHDFLKFKGVKKLYYEITYIDSESKISIENPEIYYSEIDNQFKALDVGEIYVSSLFVIDNEERTRILSYVTPVVKYGERGYLIIDIAADYFLEDIRRYQREDELIFLIDSSGYYLSNPDKSKELSNISFLDEYPVASKEIFNNSVDGVFESDKNIFYLNIFIQR
ncbi:MAG: cache domain-containing protein [Nanoarchaeota archaeon]|jgi:hypothetical protein|nr:cache domain-containing protein [Nanoarchaeota archaeon]